MIQNRSASMHTWETAEISRSAVEAQLTTTQHLRMSKRTRTRYLDPPAATPFPLEYSYHLLGDVRGRRVIDFGCGSGANSALLALRGARFCGIDISESLIQIARQRLAANALPNTGSFVVGSAHDLPVANDSVDVVFGIAILHHLSLDLVAREVHRVLKPGGRAIFQEPVRNSRVLRILRRLIPYRAPDISPFERPLTDKELAKFASGFSRCRTRSFTLPYIKLAMMLPGIGRDTDRWYRIDRAILDRFPFLQSHASIRVLEVVK